MDKRLKELAEQAGLQPYYEAQHKHIERFAELVRADEREACAQDYLQDCCNAIAVAEHNEREACAKLCDEWFASTAGRAIRERGNHEQD
jgi:hypothetical protein